MANMLKGFMQIPSLANNIPDNVATIGEISMTSRTYAREKQYVALDSEPGLQFIIFNALDDNGGVISSITGTYCQSALSLINLVRNNFDNSEDLVTFLTNNLDAAYTAISCGPIVTQDGINLPEYVQFTHTDNGGTTFKIWMSDEAFQTEYDESETYALPPVADITDLYQGYALAYPVFSSYTLEARIAATNVVTKKYPATEQTTYTIKWQDPADITNQFSTKWTILGHGVDSTRTDKVLEAIRTYLTENTAYSVDEWKEYFPDIQTLDVFSLVPLWDSVALSAGSSGESLYRPVFVVSEISNIITNMLVGRTADESDALVECFPLLYKNTPVLIMPGTSNAEGNLSFTANFPDYTVIALNDQSANRLSAATQSIITALDSLVRAAEVDTGEQSLPTGITRNLISEVSFLEKSVNNVVYRMVTKASYLARV